MAKSKLPFVSRLKKLFAARTAARLAKKPAEQFVKLSPAELVKAGHLPKSERYKEIGQKIRKGMPTISKRTFQEKGYGVSLERAVKERREHFVDETGRQRVRLPNKNPFSHHSARGKEIARETREALKGLGLDADEIRLSAQYKTAKLNHPRLVTKPLTESKRERLHNIIAKIDETHGPEAKQAYLDFVYSANPSELDLAA